MGAWFTPTGGFGGGTCGIGVLSVRGACWRAFFPTWGAMWPPSARRPSGLAPIGLSALRVVFPVVEYGLLTSFGIFVLQFEGGGTRSFGVRIGRKAALSEVY
jgi:hypothetical protein